MKTGNSGATGLAVPGVRSTCTADGAAFVDIKDGRCYTLNRVAARVLVAIEGGPAGIVFERIAEVLEIQFPAIREELEQAVTDCLAELQLAGLAKEKVVVGQ